VLVRVERGFVMTVQGMSFLVVMMHDGTTCNVVVDVPWGVYMLCVVLSRFD
jgi:uncharacterized protein YybS (DUF2232 family)